MTTLMQDVFFALRQLRKTPGFTITVLLTLALGIGANAAIFTLVHNVLLKNLPVADPKTLIRLGDTNDCCVGNGTRENGDYSLFSTATYELLKKNAPEFEELAAIQAGYAYRPIIARRDKTETEARSVMGEFVSGNYFRTFGLNPSAGRLFTDADDKTGAPMTAVISYEAWQRDHAGDHNRCRQHFLDQHQAGHRRRRCAPGILRRPHVQHASGFLPADYVHALARECPLRQ